MASIDKNKIMEQIEQYFSQNSKDQIEQDLINSGYYEFINVESFEFVGKQPNYHSEQYIITPYLSSGFSFEHNATVKYDVNIEINKSTNTINQLLDNQNKEYDRAA